MAAVATVFDLMLFLLFLYFSRQAGRPARQQAAGPFKLSMGSPLGPQWASLLALNGPPFGPSMGLPLTPQCAPPWALNGPPFWALNGPPLGPQWAPFGPFPWAPLGLSLGPSIS